LHNITVIDAINNSLIIIIIMWKPIGRRIRGRPRKRWIEDVEDDFQALGIRGWRKLSKERTEWKKITEKAKTHSGL
jgi:hypothetical protein